MALVVTAVVYPFVLRFAKKHNFVDNPNARKLQRVPVPVLGGTAVFIGFAVALGIAIMVFHLRFMGVALAATGLMWLLGTWDDMKDMPPNVRFLIESLVLWGLISIGRPVWMISTGCGGHTRSRFMWRSRSRFSQAWAS